MADIKVFITNRDATCDECRSQLGRGAWILLTEPRKALCLACGDMDHLEFLPSGDAALTRRSKKYSSLSAVVLKWSRARKRYERQGLLVESEAVARAEQECLADADVRARQRARSAERRAAMDERFIADFAKRVRELYPSCPPEREEAIAEHACLKYSGRVGRSIAARDLDGEPVRLAVIAHVRHVETPYDNLLGEGRDRADARREVRPAIDRILARWEQDPR